ncbi:sensor histidine kinase [Streptomyces sp. UH6]|uniref:sensor histidine kinase n=1 Tax=Streptomyces sp. UH6 TaxID=2748379 RepID=UPI0015D49872|nr:sensor histidine kinase [Streptomyces sp. UH6]NYV77381.1 sensor domain-containing protein [Streptomyces sp. UH6]
MSVKKAVVAAARGLALGVFSLVGSTFLLVFLVLAAALVPLGVGAFLLPPLLTAVRSHADLRRRLAERWYGVRIPAAYGPGPALPTATGLPRALHLLQDPAVRRDLRWLPVDMTAGYFVAMLPAALLAKAVEGLALAAGLWQVVADGADYWYWFLPVSGQGDAIVAGVLGLIVLHLAFRLNDRLLKAHFTLTRAVLAPSGRAVLEHRVEELARTRHDAVDTSAAELRRIERDLHDGAQARLVSMGMSLGTVEALLDRDPEQARQLLAQARAESVEALAELRDLVRGIHPPVLAERGLGDAARALALRTPVPVEADVDLPGRPEPAVESAVYFALSEMLTNVVKHAEAQRIWLELGHRDGMLRLTVTDDGRGGADPAAGTGLAGVERRLGAFDGVLAVSSPTGGPTVVTLEIPCALSSPKTSSC